MKAWAVQDAKARFSEMLDACVSEGPQLVTKRGADTAVLVPLEAWKRMEQHSSVTLKSLLLGDGWRGDLPVARRGAARRRSPPEF